MNKQPTFKVIQARIAYDEFHVLAENQEEAAQLVAAGKALEAQKDIEFDMDAAKGQDGTYEFNGTPLDRFEDWSQMTGKIIVMGDAQATHFMNRVSTQDGASINN